MVKQKKEKVKNRKQYPAMLTDIDQAVLDVFNIGTGAPFGNPGGEQSAVGWK